jgi:hypothetical protein
VVAAKVWPGARKSPGFFLVYQAHQRFLICSKAVEGERLPSASVRAPSREIIIDGRHLRHLSARMRHLIAVGRIRRLTRAERDELLTLLQLARRSNREISFSAEAGYEERDPLPRAARRHRRLRHRLRALSSDGLVSKDHPMSRNIFRGVPL